MEKIDYGEISRIEEFDSERWTKILENADSELISEIVHRGSHFACAKRVNDLCTSLKEELVGKDELVMLMAQCAVARLPMLMLGTWGTGKSLLVRQFASKLGVVSKLVSINEEDKLLAELMSDAGHKRASATSSRHFEYLVTGFTTPEELLGSVNIDLLLNRSIYWRQTTGLLPRAEIVFLDEVFKANSAILNALLAIINERVFHNAGRSWKVNLVALFAASNELPSEAELGAFYDRFPVRASCDPVKSDELGDLLERSQLYSHRSAFDAHRHIAPIASINDFRLLNKVSQYEFGGSQLTQKDNTSAAFIERFISVFRHLRVEHDLSDRSFGQYYRLARARALLNGRDYLVIQDVEVLKFSGKDVSAAAKIQHRIDQLL